jgi:iron complex transport system ATP-binding protein
MKTLLDLECVSFSFGQRRVIDRANLHIENRTCTALIGPNGGGKTTLLRLAAGLLRPSSGRILFRGAELAGLSRRDVARRIALVPQHLEIPFSFTVQQIVEQGRTPYIGMWGGLRARDRNAVERAIELTSIGPLRHRIYNELSGGERQRVKIALGLAQEPELLLLDEPTQNLDFGRLMELMALIRMLYMEGVDILAAVHDLALIQHTFSSVILINSLEPLLIGSPEDVLRPEILERAFQCLAPSFNFQPDVHPRKELAL